MNEDHHEAFEVDHGYQAAHGRRQGFCDCCSRQSLSPRNYSHLKGGPNESKGGMNCHCSYLFCCLCFTITTILTVVIVLMVVFLSVVPDMAQESTDNAVLQLNTVQLRNIGENSVDMNASVTLYNTGSHDATISATRARVYYKGYLVGTMHQPKIEVKANVGGSLLMETTLNIENKTAFRETTIELLSGNDVHWTLEAEPTLEVTIGGITTKQKVNMKNTMVLPGSEVRQSVSYNFTIVKADSRHVYGLANLAFEMVSNIEFYLTNAVVELYDSNWVYIGYAYLPFLPIKKGYNRYSQVSTVLEKKDGTDADGINNLDALYNFMGEFLMGTDQIVYMLGPVPHALNNLTQSVIDGTMNTSGVNQGSKDGRTAIAGTITQHSQTGWEYNGEHLRGAYSTVINPLPVDLRIERIEVNIFLRDYLRWQFKSPLGGLLFNADCATTNKFSHLLSQKGMWQHMPDQDWVDIPAGEAASFFLPAGPMPDQYSDMPNCLTYPFSCCFLSTTLASICRDNPNLYIHGEDSQLQKNFIETHLFSNMSILIDGEFRANVTYNQEFFPVYYGYPVYAGYLATLNVDCSNVQIKTPN